MKKITMSRFVLLLAVGVTMGMLSCTDDEPNVQSTQSITDLVVNDPNYSILETAVTRAGLADVLATTNPITVFAPNNAAFAASGITEADITSMPLARLDSILKYHVLAGFVPSSSVPVSDGVNSLLGTKIWASRNANGVFLNGIRANPADISAKNGVVHNIEKVLIPPTQSIAQIASSDTNFTFLVQAVTRVGLAGAISAPGKYTVFAPTNAAFRAAGITDINAVPLSTLDLVVKYHVLTTNVFASDLVNNALVPTLQGGNLLVNTAPAASVKIASSTQPVSLIGSANIVANNGVIHVISRVLLP